MSLGRIQGSWIQVSPLFRSGISACGRLTVGRFYYADERKADGAPRYCVDGDVHALLYWDLAHGETQGPWMQTFVQGVGYKKFDSLYTPRA